MVEEIKKVKDLMLSHMEGQINSRGIDRIDVKVLGEEADIIKDLAQAEKECWEAEYYRSVTEAMGGGFDISGYTSMGTTGSGARRGYGGSMGHDNPLPKIREMLSSASPDVRMQLRNELANM